MATQKYFLKKAGHVVLIFGQFRNNVAVRFPNWHREHKRPLCIAVQPRVLRQLVRKGWTFSDIYSSLGRIEKFSVAAAGRQQEKRN